MPIKSPRIIYGLFSLFVFCQGCDPASTDRSGPPPPPTAEGHPERPYRDTLFAFQTTLPSGWEAVTTTDPNLPRTINLMPVDRQTSDRATPSLESGQEMAYVLAIPDGLGTEIPVGSNEAWQSVAERQSYLGFAMDEARSQAFLLENDEVWGYLLYPATPPRGWSNNGFVFVQYAVDDGKMLCYDANGQPKARNDCDTMGHDTLVRRGTVSESSRSAIDLILNNWEFIEGSQRATDDLVRVDIPVPYMKTASPLTVSGEARGPYYFEGSFSVILEDNNGNTLTQASATARSDWMTEDWVPFEATLEFEAPEVKNGVVVFERANPSGLEENARRLAIPVHF